MSKTFRPWDLDQALLLPPSIKSYVPEGHIAHFVRDTVREDLDLWEIMGCYQEKRGYPPYHPVMMTALLLYAYTQGIYSSRKIALSCVQRMDFVAVVGFQAPDFRTISDFRKRHLKALSGLFKQVLGLCREAGLVKLGHVALDGSKVKANASKKKSMKYGRMEEQERELEADIAEFFRRAAEADAEEDAIYGKDKSGDELPDWVKNKEKRKAKIREAREALEKEAREKDEAPDKKSSRNLTDGDSKLMKKSGGWEQAYNTQLAVDAESQVIVGQLITDAGNDKGQLVPLLEEMSLNGCEAREISADAGYCTEENLREVKARGIRAYISPGKFRKGVVVDPKRYARPQGKLFHDMRSRLHRGGVRSRFRLRKISVEPVFGQIKSARGFLQFSLRGREKVSGEWSLVCLAHNLLKLFRYGQGVRQGVG